MGHFPRQPLFLLLWAVLAAGCSGYAGRAEQFRQNLGAGNPGEALIAVNQELGVDRAEDLPSSPDEDTPLLLLERATILQSLGEYKWSARDFQTADTSLDVLDLTTDTAGNIGKYLFSDDATVYKAPPHEKLLLNTMNLLNYLVMGDASGAKVEARRMLINRKYLEGQGEESQSMLALGSYLAGFAFEMAREPGPAIRHYADAQEAGGIAGLLEAAGRLAARTGAEDKRLTELLPTTTLDADDEDQAELLVVVQTGMAPFKVPERLPIGAAIVAASQPGPGARLSESEQAEANTFAAKGVLKWVNYPTLRRVEGDFAAIDLAVDGKRLSLDVGLDVEERVVKHFASIEGTLIAAAIVRLIARAVAGEISEEVGKQASDSGLGGLLIGLAVEGAMTAADTPDTRSWVTLPARFHVLRARLPAGEHRLELRVRGQLYEQALTLPAGSYKVLCFSAQR